MTAAKDPSQPPRRDRGQLERELDAACDERDMLQAALTEARALYEQRLRDLGERVRYLEVERWKCYTLLPIKPSPQFLAAVGMTPDEYMAFLKHAVAAINGNHK